MSCTDSAIDLLHRGDDDRIKPFLNTIWPQLLGVSFGVGTGCLVNFGTRRPLFSGLQKHIAATAVWCGIMIYWQKKRDAFFIERDAIMKDYIRLHPEDFPIPERKKIGQIFENWIPVR